MARPAARSPRASVAATRGLGEPVSLRHCPSSQGQGPGASNGEGALGLGPSVTVGQGQAPTLTRSFQRLRPPLPPPSHLAPGHRSHHSLEEPAEHRPWAPTGPQLALPPRMTLSLPPSPAHMRTPKPHL